MSATDISLSKSFAKLSIEETSAPIILYNGRGADAKCVEATHAIVSNLLKMPIRLVSEKFFSEHHPFEHIKLIIFPGGSTYEMEDALGPKGLDRLDYLITVIKIACLGICAGAILLSKERFFNGDAIERPKRPYSYFPLSYPDIFKGKAIGPVPDTVEQLSPWLRKIRIKTAQEKITGFTTYVKGVWFDVLRNEKKLDGVKVLGRYLTDLSLPSVKLPPAIIHCTDNDLNCVLCGPHPEFVSDPDISPNFSNAMFHTMFQALGFFQKDRSFSAICKSVGLKKRPMREITDCTGIEKFLSLPITTHYLVKEYCGVEDGETFFRWLPPLHQTTVKYCSTELVSLKNRLTVVIGKAHTAPSSLFYGERRFKPSYSDLRGAELRKDIVNLFKMLEMPIPEKEFPIIGNLIETSFQSLIPGNPQYEEIVKYVYKMEKE